ncbi:DNA-processing protein DprA [Candidatus Omnitrophota bacterium]
MCDFNRKDHSFNDYGTSEISCSDNEYLYKWLTVFRKYGYIPDRLESEPISKLHRTEEEILKKDVLFLEKMSVDVVMENDSDYPELLNKYLGNKNPKIIFLLGKKAILNQPSIMICGARESSDVGLDIARKCGSFVSEQGYTVASGYARGVDKAAHLGALEAGGDTLAFLPYGLSRFRVSQAFTESFDPDKFCVASEVPPTYGFTTWNALRRNKMLAAISEAVIVIEPSDSGGTWYSANRAMRMKKPLFYFEGSRREVIEKMSPLGGDTAQDEKWKA